MSIDKLPPLREIIKEHSLVANKKLGQNFLLDLNLTRKIASLAGDLTGKNVIEIGPGPGGLTRALLSLGANVLSIEADKRCEPILEQIKQVYPNNFNYIFADALKQNYQEYATKFNSKVKIIANLPYNIGTKLLINWIGTTNWPPFYESLTLMFQKEVAQRIVANIGEEHYGRLSIITQCRNEAKIVYNLPARAFTPAPKVESAVINIVPKTENIKCDIGKLGQVTKVAFNQRRKMLRQSLKPIGGKNILEQANINQELRAENLTIDQYIKLATLI